MKHYFYDNNEQKLIILNGDTNELKVMEKLNVRVIIGLTDEEDGHAKRGIPRGTIRAPRRTITCKKCGGTGHQARKCPNTVIATE